MKTPILRVGRCEIRTFSRMVSFGGFCMTIDLVDRLAKAADTLSSLPHDVLSMAAEECGFKKIGVDMGADILRAPVGLEGNPTEWFEHLADAAIRLKARQHGM